MTREDLALHISVDPNVCFGKPCIRGHRIWVSLVLDRLADGDNIDELAQDLGVDVMSIRACIAYGAEMSRYEDVPLKLSA
jgi:uncharacterized protein (DUF433 family)